MRALPLFSLLLCSIVLIFFGIVHRNLLIPILKNKTLPHGCLNHPSYNLDDTYQQQLCANFTSKYLAEYKKEAKKTENERHCWTAASRSEEMQKFFTTALQLDVFLKKRTIIVTILSHFFNYVNNILI